MKQYITEFFQPSVAGALKQFKASAAKLERVVAHHTAKQDSHQAAALAAAKRAAVAQAEATEASRLRGKFNEIFGV